MKRLETIHVVDPADTWKWSLQIFSAIFSISSRLRKPNNNQTPRHLNPVSNFTHISNCRSKRHAHNVPMLHVSVKALLAGARPKNFINMWKQMTVGVQSLKTVSLCSPTGQAKAAAQNSLWFFTNIITLTPKTKVGVRHFRSWRMYLTF